MTEDGKKRGADGAGQPDPLSATGMFLNAFQPQPDQPVEQEDESAGKWFAPEDDGGAALGGAKLGGPWGQPLNAPSVPSSAARPSLGEGKPVPGEFTQMFHKLEFAPSSPASSAPEARPAPEISRQEPGDFTRMFVRATASMPQRPMPAGSDAAAFAPPPTPRLKGFSTPGVSDSASAEGSFTQLFQSAAPAPAAPVRPFAPLGNGTEAAWSSNLDSPPSKDAMESAGVTQLFRALSPEKEPPANRFGEQSPQPGVPSSSAPASITMLIQRLTEEQSSAASSLLPASGPEPARVSEPGEFTRIMSGGSAKAAGGGSAEKLAVPTPAIFPFPAAPLPVAPAFAAPAAPAVAVPAVAVPKLQTPPIPAPPVVASADSPQSKLQQMMPMLLVLNAFLLVILIVLVVFLLKSR